MEHLAPPDYKAMFFGAVARHDALLDEIERLRVDAARYRYLRNQPGMPTPEEFDAAIDRDMNADVANAAQEEK